LLFNTTPQQRSQATTTSFQEWRRAATWRNDDMATPNKVHLTVDNTGIVQFKPQTAETAAKTSELLQENHEARRPNLNHLETVMLTRDQKHHIFFNKDGFHNHIVHHLLTLYGLGAPAEIIEQRYKENVNYQRDIIQSGARPDMSDPENFKKYLDNEKYYHEYLIFWQNEMEKKGWENVLNEYVFAGDERADGLLGRFYGGASPFPVLSKH
jgi:hypothetical protein